MDQEVILSPTAALERVKSTLGLKETYDNFIGGNWEKPVEGGYFENTSPITGYKLGQVARSNHLDIDKALDAAHRASESWARTSATERANILLKIAERIEDNLQEVAIIETLDNGKPLRETMAADIPLAVDQLRYFASAIRTQEGGISEIDVDTVAYHFHEPLGVVGQIIPWNFPILMAIWKIAPALITGNTVVAKPSELTPLTAYMLSKACMETDLPNGVLNIIHGRGSNIGKLLINHPDIKN